MFVDKPAWVTTADNEWWEINATYYTKVFKISFERDFGDRGVSIWNNKYF